MVALEVDRDTFRSFLDLLQRRRDDLVPVRLVDERHELFETRLSEALWCGDVDSMGEEVDLRVVERSPELEDTFSGHGVHLVAGREEDTDGRVSCLGAVAEYAVDSPSTPDLGQA